MAVLSLAPAQPAGLPARVELAALPTPLMTAPRLAAFLGLGLLHIKRDDLTGFALGGNKARSLEFLIADARQQGADTLVTGGAAGVQFRRLRGGGGPAGRPVLLTWSSPAEPPAHAPGLDLARSWGASVAWTGSAERASVDDGLPAVAADLAARGHRPYVVPRGGATALGAVGYALAAAELHDQLAARGLRRARVVVAVGFWLHAGRPGRRERAARLAVAAARRVGQPAAG